MKSIIINYILARLKEASTWRGIILLIGRRLGETKPRANGSYHPHSHCNSWCGW